MLRNVGNFFVIGLVFLSTSFSYRTTNFNTSFRKMSYSVDGLEFRLMENYVSDYDREYNRNTDVYIKIGRLNVVAGPTNIDIDDKTRRGEIVETDLSGYSATASGIEFGVIENGRDFKIALGSGNARITELEFDFNEDRYPRDEFVVSKVRGTLALSNIDLGMNSRFITDNIDNDAIDYFDIISRFMMRSLRYDFSYDKSKGPATMKLSSQSDLGNIDITGTADYSQGDIENSSIGSLVIKISRITPKMERLIADFEKNSGAKIDRVNRDIVIEISGSPDSPVIKGIRLPDRGERRSMPNYGSDNDSYAEADDATESIYNKERQFEDVPVVRNVRDCGLDRMVDEYEVLADKLKKAMNYNDFNTIMSINQDVLKWQQKWEAAANSATDCSLNEITSATDRMLSIEQSLIK